MHRLFFVIILVTVIIIGGYWYAKSVTIDPYTTSVENLGINNPFTSMAVKEDSPTKNLINSNQTIMNATLHTNKGDISIEFSTNTPETVANFVKLANSGFYNGVRFHRVIKGFMIQGGDPLSKDESKKDRWGTGGPGYTFKDEITEGNQNIAGTISMANAGPDTNGSQFFINTADNNSLNSKHTVFGKVVAGMDVVKAIESTPTDSNDRPIEDMVIENITLN